MICVHCGQLSPTVCERESRRTHLDLVLSVELVVVQRILRDSGTPLVQELDECNVLLCRDKTHFVQVGVLREERHELVFRDRLGQVLQEENLVGREVLVRHLDVGAF